MPDPAMHDSNENLNVSSKKLYRRTEEGGEEMNVEKQTWGF